jgi:hypothetical protein
MTHWYYASGHGLLLTNATKELYTRVKTNLGVYAEGGESPSDEEGTRCIEEIALLRAQMRLDLEIYSRPYFHSPTRESQHLLEAAGIDANGWGTPPWRTRIAERIRRKTRRVTAKLPPASH